MCDLIGFEKYLRVRGLVVESKVPFFLHWVERYLNLRLDNESVFSDVLDGEGKEDWQIRQAMDANPGVNKLLVRILSAL